MARDWENVFARWAQPPGQTEQDRMDNASRAVWKALDASAPLKSMTKVYLQGSYRNRVNVRKESDVDIGVLYTGNSFGVHYPEGVSDATTGNSDATYTYAEFKEATGRALVHYFGSAAVRRGNKAFNIHENSYRVDADVVPMFMHRRYNSDGTYICGVELHPDSGSHITNWPERLYDDPRWPNQHYENGVAKNTATGRRYKGVARILKSLRNDLDDAGVNVARPIAGFLAECLVWNVAPRLFVGNTWDEDVQNSLAYLWENTKNESSCYDWGEVSELKYLFRGSPDSKRENAHAFIDAAWSYIGVRYP